MEGYEGIKVFSNSVRKKQHRISKNNVKEWTIDLGNGQRYYEIRNLNKAGYEDNEFRNVEY